MRGQVRPCVKGLEVRQPFPVGRHFQDSPSPLRATGTDQESCFSSVFWAKVLHDSHSSAPVFVVMVQGRPDMGGMWVGVSGCRQSSYKEYSSLSLTSIRGCEHGAKCELVL